METATRSVYCYATHVAGNNAKHTWLQSARWFCTILNKFEVRKHIFVDDSKIKFHENPSSERRADT
jgi:hypothetical protein